MNIPDTLRACQNTLAAIDVPAGRADAIGLPILAVIRTLGEVERKMREEEKEHADDTVQRQDAHTQRA